MPVKFSSYKNDKDLEKDGAVMRLHDRDDPDAVPGWVRVRRANYLPFRRAVERRQYKARRQGNREPMITDFIATEQPALIGEHLIVEWGDILDDNDEPIPFTRETAVRLCKESDDFAEMLIIFANERNNYVPQNEAPVEGKLRAV